MRYRKKTNDYVTERFSFDLNTCEAWSYGWWRFVEVLRDGTIVFNNVTYSRQTSKHQDMASKILAHNGFGGGSRYGFYKDPKVKVVNIKAGLQNLEGEIDNLKYEIQKLIGLIKRPRSHASTNESRMDRISQLEAEILEIRDLQSLQGPCPNPPTLKPLPKVVKEKSSTTFPDEPHWSQQDKPSNIVRLFG